MWDFVQDVSAGIVKRDDVLSWYDLNSVSFDGKTMGRGDDRMNDGEDADPWPHTGYSSFPDMFQSLGAGELLRVHILYLCNSLFRMHSSHMSCDVSTISYRTCIKSDARTFSRTSVRASIRH